jgi:molybdopterin converting factor small subunit
MVVQIKLLLFASAKDLFGKSSDKWEFPDGSRLQDLLDRLKTEKGMDLTALRFSVAVNKKYVKEADLALSDRDEVAILPPLGGG